MSSAKLAGPAGGCVSGSAAGASAARGAPGVIAAAGKGRGRDQRGGGGIVGRRSRRRPGPGRRPVAAARGPDHLGRRRQIGDVGQAHQHHLGRGQGIGRHPRLAEALEQHLPGAGEDRHGEPFGERRAALALGLGHGDRVGGAGRQFHAGEPVGEFQQVLQHHDGVDAGRVLAGEHLERATDLAGHQRLEQVEYLRPVGEPEHVAQRLLLDRATAVGDRLVKHRQPVAHRAVGGPGGERERTGRYRRALLRGDAAEMRRQNLGVDAAQVETLAARQHGHRHPADLGGGEDEDDVLGRLLEGLQQRELKAPFESMCTSSMM